MKAKCVQFVTAFLDFSNATFKMLPVTELMNIPDAKFVKSTQSSATTEQT